MKIQMLENPRSIQVLRKVKKYFTELRKYIDDADQWLNKSNQQSKKSKYRVTQIFSFFSQICKEDYKSPEEDDINDDGDIRRTTSEKEEADDFNNPELFADEPEGEQGTAKARGAAGGTRKGAGAGANQANSKVSSRDFILFDQKNQSSNKENQRLLGSFGIDSLAMFFIKYRVDRNSVNDPFYQQLIH